MMSLVRAFAFAIVLVIAASRPTHAKSEPLIEELIERYADNTTAHELRNVLLILDKTSRSSKTGIIDPDNVIRHYVTDPMPLQDFNVSNSSPKFEGKFVDMKLSGLKSIEIKDMEVNIGQVQSTIKMGVSELKVEGHYDLNGKVAWWQVSGHGPFWMMIRDLEVETICSLNVSDSGKIEVSEMEIEIDAGDINLHFENLMGGGRWSSITNRVLNALSPIIFNQIKESLSQEIEQEVRSYLNGELAKVPNGFVDLKSATIFDDLLDKVKETIKAQGFDPMELPQIGDSFDHNMFFFRLKGEAKFFQGLLYGTSTIKRTGAVVAKYHEDSVVLDANIGFDNLTGTYDWTASLMEAGPGGRAELSVTGIDAHIRIRQPLKRNAKPFIEELAIKKIRHLWMQNKGLGTWDLIFQAIVNPLSNVFKSKIAKAISGPIKEIAQNELEKFDLPLF